IGEDGSEHVERLEASQSPSALGPHDMVVLGMKAHQVGAIAPELGPLLGPETSVVTTQNGLPWWYFHKLDSPYRGRTIESVDPGGVIARHIDVERVIACIAYSAADIVSPGVIRHIEGHRLSSGEFDG